MTLPFRQTLRGLLLDVKVTPKAARDEVVGIRNDMLLVKVTVVPERGKANAAVVALLARSAGVPKSAFEIVSGDTDRNKVLRLASHEEQVQTWLRGLQQD